jgi:thiol-disulfide isomerase/thioredoxin
MGNTNVDRHLLPAAIAIVVGVAALLIWKFASDRTAAVSRMSLGIGLAAVPAGIAFGLLAVFAPPPRTVALSAAPAPQRPLPPAGDYPVGPLARGDKVPPFEVEGWLNGTPPAAGVDAPRLTVVDFWSYWCPGCRATAPGLVEVYQKYKDRQVAFVSVTSMPRVSTEDFVRSFAVPWPCAYGATNQTLARFGAFNPDSTMHGYEVKLTFYLVGADERVLWNDGSARQRHQSPDLVLRELEDQIERALAATPSDGEKDGKQSSK